jgi:hypothetical protein
LYPTRNRENVLVCRAGASRFWSKVTDTAFDILRVLAGKVAEPEFDMGTTVGIPAGASQSSVNRRADRGPQRVEKLGFFHLVGGDVLTRVLDQER